MIITPVQVLYSGKEGLLGKNNSRKTGLAGWFELAIRHKMLLYKNEPQGNKNHLKT